MADEERTRDEVLLSDVAEGTEITDIRTWKEKLLADAAAGEETRPDAREREDLFINEIDGSGGGGSGPDLSAVYTILNAIHGDAAFGNAVRFEYILHQNNISTYLAGKGADQTSILYIKAALYLFIFAAIRTFLGESDLQDIDSNYSSFDSATAIVAFFSTRTYTGIGNGILAIYSIIPTFGVDIMYAILHCWVV